ncbi:hypothetical protein QUF94_12755 [Peribacillus sp. NJ4]|uniref:hypothetical protein n=1 Tax=Peribacillus TaxID=2675229 RepID=UPI0025A157D2|nr:hypothetical protein [Peribacillus sp. NJ4]MDM5212311.1 hypothetical protein [Peribacillus sp. NJ4]
MVEIRGIWSRWFPFKAGLLQQKLDGTANKRLVQMGTLQWTCSYIGLFGRYHSKYAIVHV